MLDKNKPYAIISKVPDHIIENGINNTDISIDPNVKSHAFLSHYCSLETLNSILNSKSIKFSQLCGGLLNDRFEYKRKNIEAFAGSVYICCFTHCAYEIVSFWLNYGGGAVKDKVLLRFKNFANNILGVLNMNYCYSDEGMKLFYRSEEFSKTVNTNGIIGNNRGLQRINKDFDTRASVVEIDLFDMAYLPITDNVFTADYSTNAGVKFNPHDPVESYTIYLPEVLGKHKTIHWSHEQETRIKVQLHPFDVDFYKSIFINIDDCLFDGLEIVMSPWSEPNMEGKIMRILDACKISNRVKASISIHPSELTGQISEP